MRISSEASTSTRSSPLVGMLVGAVSTFAFSCWYFVDIGGPAATAETLAVVALVLVLPFIARWPISAQRALITAAVWLILGYPVLGIPVLLAWLPPTVGGLLAFSHSRSTPAQVLPNLR
jgi:hypothetical protein